MPTANVLIYSAAMDYVHDSIPTAIDALRQHGPSIDVVFTHTNNSAEFTDENLSKFDGVLFLSNTGEGNQLQVLLCCPVTS
jgi:hypothetical protein